MGDVSKFIPINGNGENGENNIFGGIENVGTTGNPCGTGTTWEAGNVTTDGTTNSTPNSSVSGNNPNTTDNTWEAGNLTTEGTTNTSSNSGVTGNPSTTETTWEAGNVTTPNSNTTSNSSTTGNTWSIGNTTPNSSVTGNSNPTENTWKIGSTCTTGTTTNTNVSNTTNTGINVEEPVTSGFRVCGTSNNLPAKPSFWARLKSFFFYDTTTETTQCQSKTENVVSETNVPQESTWTKIKKWFLFETDSNNN